MTSGAQRALRLASAIVVGAAAATVLAAVAVGTTATSTRLLMTELEDTALYRLGIPVTAAELADSDIAAEFNKGPLRLTRDDIHEILVTHFGAEDVALKAREFHSGVLRYIRAYPRDSIFRMSIRRERPILVRAAKRRMLENYRSLPDCDAATDLGILGRAGWRKLFGGGSAEAFLESLPSCHPPGPVAKPVIEGVEVEMRRMTISGADSLDAFPDPATVRWATYSGVIRRIQTVDRTLARSAWIWLGGILLIVIAAGTIGGRVAVLPGGWLVVWALGAGLVAVGLGLRFEDLSTLVLAAFGAEPGQGSEIQRLWLDLASYALGRVLRFASSALLVTGAVLAASGTAGLWVARE